MWEGRQIDKAVDQRSLHIWSSLVSSNWQKYTQRSVLRAFMEECPHPERSPSPLLRASVVEFAHSHRTCIPVCLLTCSRQIRRPSRNLRRSSCNALSVQRLVSTWIHTAKVDQTRTYDASCQYSRRSTYPHVSRVVVELFSSRSRTGCPPRHGEPLKRV